MYIFKAFYNLGTEAPFHAAYATEASNSHSRGSFLVLSAFGFLLSLPKIQSSRMKPTQTWQKAQVSC